MSEQVERATWYALRAAHGREAAVLWLGHRAADAVVTTVIRLHGEGIDEGIGHFEAVPEVVGAITRWAKPQELTLLASCHAHPAGVAGRLSQWDRRHGFAVPEFLSIVAGDGGRDTPSRWGWYVFDRGTARYRPMDDGERARRVLPDNARVAVFLADTTGVRAWP